MVRKRKFSGGGGATAAATPFAEGAEVELRYDDDDGFQGAWLEAVVLQPLPGRRLSYSVAHSNLVSEEDPSLPLTEVISASHIRPRPPPPPTAAPFSLHQTVDAFHNCSWWPGVISAVRSPTLYTVCFPTSREELDFPPSDVRHHAHWSGLSWSFPDTQEELSRAKYQAGAEVEISGNGQNYRAVWIPGTVVRAITRKTFLVEYKVGIDLEKEMVDLQYIRPRKGHSITKKKRGRSSDKLRIELARGIPIMDKEIGAANPDSDGLNAGGNEGKDLPVVTPFRKSHSLWASIESMEIFHQMPQQPHFRPLEQYSLELREDMALRLMATYACLVTNVSNIPIFASQLAFDEKLKALVPLDDNGFDVVRIRSRLEKLLEIQDIQRRSLRKKATLRGPIFEKEKEKGRLDALALEFEKNIRKMEQDLASLFEKREIAVEQRKSCESELARLHKDMAAAEEDDISAEKHFSNLVASPWQ